MVLERENITRNLRRIEERRKERRKGEERRRRGGGENLSISPLNMSKTHYHRSSSLTLD
jgi:hypothetical protein